MKLSPTMQDALLAFPASDEEPSSMSARVREGTRIALEERGLTESFIVRDFLGRPFFRYRRTNAGDDIARETAAP